MFDVAIIGGGPSGLTAGIYCARAGLSVALFEMMFTGGQAAITPHIENYPGFPNGVDGAELGALMRAQAEKFGLSVINEQVTALELHGEEKRITADSHYAAKTVICSMGARPRKLGVEGEERLTGSGVSYCATCDGAFYRGRSVAVVGGGDTAAEDALILAGIADNVHLIHRRDTLRASQAQARRVLDDARIQKHFGAKILSIEGGARVTGIELQDGDGGQRRLTMDAVFIAVGVEPQTELVKDVLPCDAEGYILAGEDTVTPIPGVFAAGDVRKKPLRQVVTAAADGAVAGIMAERFLMGLA